MLQIRLYKNWEKKINYNGLAYIELGASKTYFPERIFEEIMNAYKDLYTKRKKCINLIRKEELIVLNYIDI